MADALSVRVLFCSSAVAGDDGLADVPVRIRVNASIREIMGRLGQKIPRFAGGKRLQIVSIVDAVEIREDVTSAQQLLGGERLLVLHDHDPVFEQGRQTDTVATECQVWENALPEWLMVALETELASGHRQQPTPVGALSDNKMHTWWVPLTPQGEPVHDSGGAIHEAIRRLYQLMCPDWQGSPPVGAEWWCECHRAAPCRSVSI
jgi:hypothetical protein